MKTVWRGWAISTQYQRVTDGRTDGRTDGQTDVQHISITCAVWLMHVKKEIDVIDGQYKRFICCLKLATLIMRSGSRSFKTGVLTASLAPSRMQKRISEKLPSMYWSPARIFRPRNLLGIVAKPVDLLCTKLARCNYSSLTSDWWTDESERYLENGNERKWEQQK